MAVLAAGCPYGPPIIAPPPNPEAAPFFFTEDIIPSNRTPVVVDLTQSGATTFLVRNIFDPTGGVLRYRWALTRQDGLEIPLGQGTLQPRLEQPFPDQVVYEGPALRNLALCPLPFQATARLLLIRVDVTRELVGQDIIPGQSEFTSTVTWVVTLEGQCED